MPLDRDPALGGNVVVTAGGIARLLRAGEVPVSLDSYLWMPHFATCPGKARGRDEQRRALRRTHERVDQELALEPGDVDQGDVQQLQRTLPFAVQVYLRGGGARD